MRIGILFAVAASWLLLAPARAQAPPEGVEIRQPERQPTAGSTSRSDDDLNGELEIMRRGVDMKRGNEGLRGRVNSTNDAARDAELPRAFSPGFSPWGRY